jgi:aspartyl-tRNA(Asn)/glutamyl-tRNA(Gln) amidotransferase subunit A
MPLSWTMDKIGPMCRSAEDCGHVLQAISGGDYEDPTSSGKSYYYTPQFARKFSDLTIGYAPADFEEWAEEPLRPALREAFDVLKGLGCKLLEVELPDLPYGPVTGTIIDAEGSAVFEELITSGGADQLADAQQIAGLKAGLDIKAKDYLRAMRIRRLIQQAFREIFVDVSVLVTPSRMNTAPDVDRPFDAQRSDRPRPESRGLHSLIPAGNLAGLPALSLPCGFANGLPVGISLVGRPYYENTLLAMGVAYQKQTDWHRRRPPSAG